MFRLDGITQEESIARHRAIPVRVYQQDPTQRPRIERTRMMLERAVARGPRRIVELACGTADISGPFADQHGVMGVDCHEAALAVAKQRFPQAKFLVSSIEACDPMACDVLVLCETLEHLCEPNRVVSDWAPEAKQVLISHPIDEALGSGVSAGEHRWSFSADDFEWWFKLGGHSIVEREEFQMGAYRIFLARGIHNGTSAV